VLVTLSDRVGRPPSPASLLWALFGLAGLTVGTTLQARVGTQVGATAAVAVQVAAGFAVLAVWAPMEGQVALPLSASGLASFAWLAVVAGMGAPLLLLALVRRRGATAASSHLYVVPAVTALAAWPMLGTPLGTWTVVGLAIVVLALMLTTGRLSGPHRATPRVLAAAATPKAALGHVSQSLAAPDAAQITRWRRCRPFEDAQSARAPARAWTTPASTTNWETRPGAGEQWTVGIPGAGGPPHVS